MVVCVCVCVLNNQRSKTNADKVQYEHTTVCSGLSKQYSQMFNLFNASQELCT